MNLVLFWSIVVAVLLVAAALFRRSRRRRNGHHGAESSALVPTRTDAAPLRSRLGKTRQSLTGRLGALAGQSARDEDFWAELEDTLVGADVGIVTSRALVTAVRAGGPGDGREARSLLAAEMNALLAGRSRVLRLEGSPAVILVVGVNGGGKTTSIAKIAASLKGKGATVVLGAADTFRAAADHQLRTWADRLGVDVVVGQTGADPASVAFDAYSAGRSRGADVVIIDTAGRLQSKTNLMQELSKVAGVLRREADALDEVLLVIDGTTGQNAVAQARTFADAVGVTGIVITKLDGTARGGVAVAIEQELDIPVKFIGVGEGMMDLVPFSPGDFVDALLGE